MTSTQRIAAAWYAYGYLREVVLIYPVYAIMFGQHGISALQLSTLFVVWAGSALVFEVPSGVLADRYSRKRLLVLSGLIKGSAFIVWWISPDFVGYLTGFALWGAGSSLVSGTSESFLFDTLAERGDGGSFARIYGRGMAASSLGIATALAAGGYIAEGGYALPLALSIAAPWASALVVAVLFVEPPRSGTTVRTRFWTTLADGWAEVRSGRTILFIVAMFATLVTTYGVVDEYVGPLLNEKQFALRSVGFAYAAAFVSRTIGMELAHRLPLRALRAIALLFGIGVGCFGVALFADGFVLIAAYSSYFMLSSAGEVLLQTRLQQAIRGTSRATVTSFAKMSEYATSLPLYLFIGALADAWSFQIALGATAALVGVTAAAFVATAGTR
jgi:MFS family permease